VAIPVLQTDPTELMSTPAPVLGARHMVAALVLLDVFIADWALFGVDNDPVHIFSL